VSHANAPLTPEGRRRLAVLIVERHWSLRRAAERFQCSPATAKKWADRYRAGSPLTDRSSRPHRSPTRLPRRTERRVIALRFTRRWGPHRIAYHLGLARSSVGRVLHRYLMPLLTHLDQATGLPVRRPRPIRYEMTAPGQLVHADIKKLGRIPNGGGHRSSAEPRAGRTTPEPVAGTRSCTTPSTTTPDWRTPRSSTTNARRPPLASGTAPARTSRTRGSPCTRS